MLTQMDATKFASYQWGREDGLRKGRKKTARRAQLTQLAVAILDLESLSAIEQCLTNAESGKHLN